LTATLEGKVAIVTGAAGGIGQAYARGMAREGASVVIADLNGDGAAAVAAQMTTEGFKAISVTLDVANQASAEAMAEQVTSKFGGVDILVNNAALMADIPRGGLCDVPLEVWDQVNRVNVTGPLICTRAVVESMKARGGGKIVNQASAAAFLPGSVYRISKHSLVALTAGLGVELAKFNINVNAIAPGLIASEGGFRAAGPMGSAERSARYGSFPNPRPDRPPEDLVPTLLLLVGPGSDYINGQTFNVDGGWVIRL
jgi:NAD(P)-dependent dehydrogenase (short-subunit alcohol dehydrogenase family)